MESEQEALDRSVEVIIVSYNTADLTSKCLASLRTFATTARDYDLSIAVLDNASSDGTANRIREEFPDVRLVESKTNLLYGPANNFLIATSDADFVLLLNPDCYVENDIVTPLVDALTGAPDDVVLAYPSVRGENNRERQDYCSQFPTPEIELAAQLGGTKIAAALKPVWDVEPLLARRRPVFMPALVPHEMMAIWSTCVLMRTSTAREFGPFHPEFPMYDTDLDLCLRLAERGLRAIHVPDADVFHVGGASSTPEHKRQMQLEARRRIYSRHGSLLGQALYSLSRGVPVAKEVKTRVMGS